jgi:hypothetical protein
MNKSYTPQYRRVFLVSQMPEPLTPASPHMQYFDNYIADTNIRLRAVRDPATKEWSRTLEKRVRIPIEGESILHTVMMPLDETDYAAFERFEGSEIRKNRYFGEVDDRRAAFDIYLGPLWGLNVMTIVLDSAAEVREMAMPSIAVIDVTNEELFDGPELVKLDFDVLRARVDAMRSPA